MQPKAHWENVYETKPAHTVSWFQEHPELGNSPLAAPTKQWLIRSPTQPHRRGAINQQVNVQIFFLLEQAQQQPIHSPVDRPVEVAQIVARRVVPMVRKLDARALTARPSLRTTFAGEHLLGDDVQVLKLLEKLLIEARLRRLR